MTKLTVLVGLPGSGKTIYGERLSKETSAIFLDDCSRTVEIKEIVEAIVSGNGSAILADPLFCRPDFLKEFLLFAESLAVTPEIIYFENNLSACWNNVCGRSDGRPISKDFMQALSRGYRAVDPTISVFKGGNRV